MCSGSLEDEKGARLQRVGQGLQKEDPAGAKDLNMDKGLKEANVAKHGAR